MAREEIPKVCRVISLDSEITDKLMKICLIGPSKRFFSGLSAYTICLANALSRSNNVSVVLLRNLLPRFLYPGKGHVGREDYLLNFSPYVKVFDGLDWNSPLSWSRAYRFLKREKPDVIIMLWWTSSVAHMQLFLEITSQLTIKAKVIVEIHEIVDPLEEGILPVRFYSRVMGKLLMGRADGFVAHSASVRKQVIRIYHRNTNRIFVIPHGLYDAYRQDCDKKNAKQELRIKEDFVILQFGTIRRHKGTRYLIEAFGELSQNIAARSRLVIAGEDWGDESHLGELIDFSPYRNQISFQPQFVPDVMIPKYFCAADIVVLPYLRTAGSGVANIAMAYGKPIISSDLDVMRECLMGYEGALFVSPHDSTAIASKLEEIYNLYASGQVIIYQAPQNTWAAVARQYEQMIKQHLT
jgi:glycosyltransferase involved in cell wall biosynthesis